MEGTLAKKRFTFCVLCAYAEGSLSHNKKVNDWRVGEPQWRWEKKKYRRREIWGRRESVFEDIIAKSLKNCKSNWLHFLASGHWTGAATPPLPPPSSTLCIQIRFCLLLKLITIPFHSTQLTQWTCKQQYYNDFWYKLTGFEYISNNMIKIKVVRIVTTSLSTYSPSFFW